MKELTKEEIKQKILEEKWDRWLERPWGAFLLSNSEKAITREYMRKVGVDVELKACVHERGNWYLPENFMKECGSDLMKWINSGHSVFEITKGAEKFYKKNKKYIKKLIKSKKSNAEKLKELNEILIICMTYIWVTHPLETAFTPVLRKEASKFVKADEVEKFMGDVSIPSKKNAHALMSEAIIMGVNPKKIAKEYGWIKVRSSFTAEGFTEKDIIDEKDKFIEQKGNDSNINVKIPRSLVPLVKQVKELVWFRTFRTDMWYEFVYLARPILDEVAKSYKMEYKDLENYRIQDLISGTLQKYPRPVNFANYNGNFAYFDSPILPEREEKNVEIKGVVAFKGKIKGTAKIVRSPHDVSKVGVGDVLVAPMTFPSFIVAMNKAAAFVTDEGGITCHAAIVSREMKKPCIVGTKNATKVLRDGDFIEVDAEKGIVRKIEK